MAREHLGATIDIHGGGQDLVFPHHENEIAQSRCAHDAPLARYWVHNGMIRMGESKMAKSRGNILTIRELRAKFPGEVLRLALLSARYRDPLEWSDELVASSRRRLDRLYRVLLDCRREPLERRRPARGEGAETVAGEGPGAARPSTELIQALEDDLNTPAALGALAGQARKVRAGETEPESGAASLRAGGDLLGLLQQDPQEWFTAHAAGPPPGAAAGGGEAAGKAALAELSAGEIEARIRERAKAREGGDYSAADRIREQLGDAGVILEDGPAGTTWRRAAL